MKKNKINITESEVKKLIESTVMKYLKEGIFDPNDPEYYSDKGIEFDNDWEELTQNNGELGYSADDIFNGHYDKGDYFEDSDYEFTHDASGMREPNPDSEWSQIGRGIYGRPGNQWEVGESTVRESVSKVLKNVINEHLNNKKAQVDVVKNAVNEAFNRMK